MGLLDLKKKAAVTNQTLPNYREMWVSVYEKLDRPQTLKKSDIYYHFRQYSLTIPLIMPPNQT